MTDSPSKFNDLAHFHNRHILCTVMGCWSMSTSHFSSHIMYWNLGYGPEQLDVLSNKPTNSWRESGFPTEMVLNVSSVKVHV